MEWNGYFKEWTFWIPRDAQKQHHVKPLVNSPRCDIIGKLEISFYLFVATGVWNSRSILQSIKPFGITICKTVSTTAVQITLQIIPFGFYTSIILVLKNGGIIVSIRLFTAKRICTRITWNIDFIIACQNLIGLYSWI